MKHARTLYDTKRVTNASWSAPVVRGNVQDGGVEYRAGLKVISATNVENLCSCRASRQQGMICAHSLAVGLAVLRGNHAAAEVLEDDVEPSAAKVGPAFRTDAGEGITLHVIVAPNFDNAWTKNSITIGAEVDYAGRRILLSALPPKGTYLCTPEDLPAIQKLLALGDGTLPGILLLTREQARELLQLLKGHPRVTSGKTTPLNVEAVLAKVTESGAATWAKTAQLLAARTLVEPEQPSFSVTIDGSLNFLQFQLIAQYKNRSVVVRGETLDSTVTKKQGNHRGEESGRNRLAEMAAFDNLGQYGFSNPDREGRFALQGERNILRFIAERLPILQKEWKVTFGSRFAHVSQAISRVEPEISLRGSGQDWFEVGISLNTPGGETLSASEIQRLLRSGQNHTRLRDGSVAVFDGKMVTELQEMMADCDPEQRQPGVYRLKRMHAGYLDAVVGSKWGAKGSASWASAARTVENMRPIPLGHLEETLRPYQKQGVYWMNFLAENSFGGILADEMGLGKTLQALAFLRHRASRRLPALIVCPASLIYNWKREAERWTPELSALPVEGPGRKRLFERIKDYQIIITSYPLLRRDVEKYYGIEFDTVILDEAQHIKNPDTENAQSASMLRSRQRFVLTGTPMENSVRDLWSIMNFLMPGYLGGRQDFRERYELPISRNDPEAKARLSKRLRPFLLRRRKKEVVTELPDKLEQVTYCELNAEQRRVYDALLEGARQTISKASASGAAGQARMLTLTALLRLRQTCCDLRLLDGASPRAPEVSGKMQMLFELVQEAIDGGHRILIFSQFVTMLGLIRERLLKEEIAFCYLDGQTKDRGAVVDAFQGGDAPVFLISLKAGGTGLNLTAADTVIHFDPWWNPAVEAQATDRAHRIGQTSVVMSYKLITRGTVEEKILKLQKSKRELINATVESEEPLMTSLTMAEIESLLE